MAFVVEDGTGKVDSNSYASTQEFDNYCNDRGYTAQVAWTTSRKQIALVKATDFIFAVYRTRFKGRVTNTTQALPWPRIGVVIDGDGEDIFIPGTGPITNGIIIASNVIPPLLKNATIELALKADANILAPDIKPGDGAIERQKVGPVEISYKGRTAPSTLWRFADALLQPFLTGSSLSIPIIRA